MQRRSRCHSLIVFAGALLASVAIGGCAARRAASPQVASTIDMSAEGTGLQIISWTLGAQSLLDLSPSPAAVAPRMQEAWESSGMLVARVPLAQLDALAQGTAFTSPPQQQLLAFSPLRAEALRGDPSAYDTLRLDTGVMPLRNAAARLLVRGWPVPDVPGATQSASESKSLAAAVQVELVPQVVSLVRPRRTGLERVDNTPEGQGVVLSRLVLETTLHAGEALIIFPARAPAPDQAQRVRTKGETPSVPAPPARRRSEAQADEALPDAPSEVLPANTLVIDAEEAGPALPTVDNLPNFGDALLTDALALPTQGTRRVLIIVPRPPASYSLLRP